MQCKHDRMRGDSTRHGAGAQEAANAARRLTVARKRETADADASSSSVGQRGNLFYTPCEAVRIKVEHKRQGLASYNARLGGRI